MRNAKAGTGAHDPPLRNCPHQVYYVFGKSRAGFAAKKLNARIWKWCHIVGMTGQSSTKRVPTDEVSSSYFDVTPRMNGTIIADTTKHTAMRR